uniref:Uncharacterized protein n=1 Tax=Anguilla anguilla TaxID=7936 RepID=A0A0E9VU53_ANGAN
MVSEDAVTAWLSIQLNGKVPFLFYLGMKMTIGVDVNINV